MPRPDDFHAIPTLTQRAEPTLRPDDPHAPVLREIVPGPGRAPAADVPRLDARADEPGYAPGGTLGPEPAAPDASPREAVLRAALQAEIERAVQAALQDAVAQMQARLDDELPALVARALQRVRPG
ncbi:hypothetical protein [Bordetella sp. 2513F-2]